MTDSLAFDACAYKGGACKSPKTKKAASEDFLVMASIIATIAYSIGEQVTIQKIIVAVTT